MKQMKKGQMDLSDRMVIEIGLSVHDSFKKMAEDLGRHPSTVTKEILKNRHYIPGSDFMGNDCRRARQCQWKRHLCGDEKCLRTCIACRKWDCREHCDHYVRRHCKRPDEPPYVCNTCSEKRHCTLDRYIYSAKDAQKVSDERRSVSRRGIRLSDSEIDSLNRLLLPMIKKGQPMAHIYATHKDEIPIALRTLYNYVGIGVLEVKNIDLRRKVRYRKRKKEEEHKAFIQEYRKGRTYEDYLVFIRDLPEGSQVEMDTIIGSRGSGKRILSMMQVKSQLLLLFLMPDGRAESVKRIFDHLEGLVGTEVFQRLFPVFLTDNGSEFKDVEGLEANEFGELRSLLFYCDPMCSWQKPHIEKAHEFVRYVLPKGKSFKDLTQADLTLLMNHINSVKRHSLGEKCPYERIDENDKDTKLLMEKLKMHLIPADEVHLTRSLLR